MLLVTTAAYITWDVSLEPVPFSTYTIPQHASWSWHYQHAGVANEIQAPPPLHFHNNDPLGPSWLGLQTCHTLLVLSSFSELWWILPWTLPNLCIFHAIKISATCMKLPLATANLRDVAWSHWTTIAAACMPSRMTPGKHFHGWLFSSMEPL